MMATKVIKLAVNDDKHRLTLTAEGKETSPRYRFKAEILPDKEGDETANRYFDNSDEAYVWLNRTTARRKRAFSKNYSFPITVEVPAQGKRPHSFKDATIRGVHANEGLWKITVNAEKTSSSGKYIHRRMLADDAYDAARLANKIRELEYSLYQLRKRYELELPHMYGKTNPDRAIELNIEMAKLFEDAD